MNIDEAISLHVANLDYEALPEEVVQQTKLDLLDVLGTTIAGSRAPGVGEIAELIEEWGGKKESDLICFDCKVPSENAAFLNGTMAHAMDYDDCHDRAVLHAAASVVPASFAIAQRKGNISGKEFICAVALGIDLVCRLGLACRKPAPMSGWIYTSIFGYFGAAAASGKLLGLDENGILNSLGIAYSQCAGGFQCITDASLTKRMQPGLAARGGVLSALLAEKGIEGVQHGLAGKYGVFNIYLGGDFDPDAITAGLGQRFENVNLSLKPYPCCRGTHCSIEAVLQILDEHEIDSEEIEEIIVITGENSRVQFEPIERKRSPRSIPDAQWSVPYTVARAIVHREVTLSAFSEEAIKDSRVLGIAEKVQPRFRPDKTKRENEACRIEIRKRTGETVSSKQIDWPKGDPKNPMSLNEVIRKFKDCASHGRKIFSKRKVESLIDMMNYFEEIESAENILNTLQSK